MAKELKAKGNAFFKKQEWDNAIAEYTKAIDLNEKIEYHTYYSNRSACYAGKGDFENSLKDANKCIELKPDFVKGYSRKGLALYRLKKFNESKKAYEDGLKLSPNDISLKSGLDQANKAIENNNNNKNDNKNNPFAKMFEPSRVWMTIHNNPELREMTKDASFNNKVNLLIKNPQMAMQMNMLQDPQMSKLLSALLGINMQGPPPSASSTNTQNDNDNNNNNNNNNKKNEDDADIEIDTNEDKKQKEKTPTPEPEPELTEEEKQEKEIKDKANKLKNEGNEFYKEKKYDKAIIKYLEAQKLDPTNPAYVLNESAVLYMENKYDECIKKCEIALKICKDNLCDYIWSYKAYERMGKVFEKQKKLDKAIEFYEKALIEKSDRKLRDYIKRLKNYEKKKKEKEYINPELSLKLKDEGNELFKNGKWADALAKYSDAIRRNPKDYKLYSNRATTYCKLMSWDAAMDDCDKAIKLNPKFQKAWIRKGKIQHVLKQYHKAVKCFEEAEKIDPNVSDLKKAKRETLMAIQSQNTSGQRDEQAQARAMQDPEVQAAMQDPEVSSVLLQAQSGDVNILRKAMMEKPRIRKKIETLIAAGVLRMG